MRRPTVSAEFISGANGPVFLLLRRPVEPPTGCVLVVPPFAEEMNKCRRMVTEMALGLAEQGVATLLPDLYGTGDSGGDFADADWSTWVKDLAASERWVAAQGIRVTGILGVRLGCALAVAAVEQGAIRAVGRTVFWQPVFDGGRFLGQFLRLRVAANLLEDRKETLTDLRCRLRNGEAVEVAGYRLSGRLASDLDAAAVPEYLPAGLGEVSWLEVVREAGASLLPPSQQMIERFRTAGSKLQVSSIPGEPFWTSTEIVVNDRMVDETVDHFGRAGQREGLSRA